MKLKTYRAVSMKQALDEIKKELGQDAFILSGKEVKGKKVMGLFGKSYFEVTAAVDHASNTTTHPEIKWASADPVGDENGFDHIQDTFKFSFPGARRPAPSPGPQSLVTSAASAVVRQAETEGSEREGSALLEEIRQLRSMIQSIPRQVSPLRPSHSYRSPKFAHPVYEEIYLDLVSRELDEDLACELIDDVIKEKKGTGFPNRRQVARKIAVSLSHRMHFCEDLIKAEPPSGQKVLVMLGPTGVGKTTTLAKLAARAVLEQRLKVGFITVDTFRIAATEQLKTYAEIIDVPTKVVENVRFLDRALQEFADKDLVMIDTAGRSPREVDGLSELAESLNALPGIHKALLLAAPTKRSDLIEIVEKYKIFDPSCVIFTKLDETFAYGSVVSQLVRSTCPLAYVTVGQNVPKDILTPDAARLVSLFEASDGIGLKELRESSPVAAKASTRALRKKAIQEQNTFTHKGVNHECLTRPQL